jgi:tripartite-type tricarboxylate transporter receptor subunit TctC
MIRRKNTMRALTIVAALMLGLTSMLGLRSASAQDYPTRPITMVVPFPAGGPTDTVARVTAQEMSKLLGQQIVVENVGGAGGTLGAARVARAAPDGYTLLINHLGLASAATLYRKLPYDTKTAFAPIGLVTDAPMTIIGRLDLKPNTLSELVTFAKAEREKVTFANAGLGAASHLCGMLFQSAIGTKLTAVPYRGGGPLLNDLLGGQVDLGCEQATTSTGPISAKRVKAYAVTTKTRLSSLPELPTADEAGLKGFEIGVWHGLYAPAGTPAAPMQKLVRALQAALKNPELGKRFADINTEPIGEGNATPEALRAKLVGEIERWAPIIKEAGQYAD